MILIKIGVIGHRNNTQCQANKSCYEIIDENREYAKRLGFTNTLKEKTLLIMYLVPKMHKCSTGTCLLIASKILSAKQLAKSASDVVKLLYSQIENFHKNAKFLSNYNKFWVLEISDPIIQPLTSMNDKNVLN